jgi:hypothetical protein
MHVQLLTNLPFLVPQLHLLYLILQLMQQSQYPL